MNTLNENIVRLRKQAGMTQEELGRRVMVSTQAVSRWERGGSPDIALLPVIAQVPVYRWAENRFCIVAV